MLIHFFDGAPNARMPRLKYICVFLAEISIATYSRTKKKAQPDYLNIVKFPQNAQKVFRFVMFYSLVIKTIGNE